MPVTTITDDVIDLSVPVRNTATGSTVNYTTVMNTTATVLNVAQALIPEPAEEENPVIPTQISDYYEVLGLHPQLNGSYSTIRDSQMVFTATLLAWIKENIPIAPRLAAYTLPQTRYSSISLDSEPFFRERQWIGPMRDHQSALSILIPHPLNCAMKFLKSPITKSQFRLYFPDDDRESSVFWGWTSTGSKIPIFESNGHFLVIHFFSQRVFFERSADLKLWFQELFSRTNYAGSETVGIFAAIQQIRQSGVVQKIEEVKTRLGELASTTEELYSIRVNLEQELEIIKSATSRDELLGTELELMKSLIPSKYKYINFSNATGKLIGRIDPVVIIYQNRYYKYPPAMVMLDLQKNKIEVEIDDHPHMSRSFCFGGYRDSLHQMLTTFQLYGLFFTISNSLASYNPSSAYGRLDPDKEISKEAYEGLLAANNVPVPQSADEGPTYSSRIERA